MLNWFWHASCSGGIIRVVLVVVLVVFSFRGFLVLTTFHAGATIFNSSNFIVTTVFNFHNLKKWAACTAILNSLNFVVTPIFNFHNLKKWVGGACLKD